MSAAQCVSCSKQEHITKLRTCVWYWLHSSSGIDGVYSWNSCDTQSNGKVKTKSHLFSCLVLAGSVSANVLVAPNRNKLPHNVNLSGTGFTHLLALYWLMVFIHETHVMPSSGKVYTKRHLFSYLVISGSECCPMCQLIHTGTNYHYTYIWMVLVAPIFWHYIDWWCLFMKHMWCHLVAK